MPDRSDRDNKRAGPFKRAIFGEMARSRSLDLPSDSAPGYASVNSIKKFYARNSPHSGLRSARIAVCPCGLPAHYYGVAITIATYSSPCDGSASFCLWLTCVLDAVRGAAYQTALAAEPLENARYWHTSPRVRLSHHHLYRNSIHLQRIDNPCLREVVGQYTDGRAWQPLCWTIAPR